MNDEPRDLDSHHELLQQHSLLPKWCNVLEGMSDEDLAELKELFELPVRLAR